MAKDNLVPAFRAAAERFGLSIDPEAFAGVDAADDGAVKDALAASGLDARFLGDQVVLSVNFPVMAASHARLGRAAILLYSHGGAMLVTGGENYDETLVGEYFGEFIKTDDDRELWKQYIRAAIFVDGGYDK